MGLLEVKCPYSAVKGPHALSPAEASKTIKSFPLQDINGTLQLSKNHHYYYQVQGQLHITCYQWADFVVWTPAEIATTKCTLKKKLHCRDLLICHEEADVIIIHQIAKAAESGIQRLNVVCEDTDVIVVLLHYYTDLQLTCRLTKEGLSSE
uniref:YqaJ viral recombinase domain-containing protein n=1 Tax=Branchiostoma floridae TaxID=7739 RepID=C3Z189_BRAFL|eukprot:XP_002597776.1 hypothetical protein BRAFLDRAFT_77321 [Branchiostoma floridae]